MKVFKFRAMPQWGHPGINQHTFETAKARIRQPTAPPPFKPREAHGERGRRVILTELEAEYDRARADLVLAPRERFTTDAPDGERDVDGGGLGANFDWVMNRAWRKAKDALR